MDMLMVDFAIGGYINTSNDFANTQGLDFEK
jgi:hypothetical protein